jgi:anthranilate synthase component 1
MNTLRPPVAELPGSPDLLALHARLPHRYPFLLESAASGGEAGSEQARFDILFAFPGATLELGADWQLRGTGRDSAHGHAPGPARFLDALDAWCGRRAAQPASDLPFSGGWFVYAAYELAQDIEPQLQLRSLAGQPVARAVHIPAAVLRDRRTGRSWAVAEPEQSQRLATIVADVSALHPAAADDDRRPLMVAGSLAEEPPEQFLAAVERVQGHIAAGDVYQANISRRWQAATAEGVAPWQLYARLRRTNPAPFAGLAVFPEMAIVSSSPERLLQIHGPRIETRPIAGTRPRLDPAGDALLRAELRAHPKEQAEHVMLIDLERNDLGKVCVAGSVRVAESMAVESYAHVHHIVSVVEGRLRPEVGAGGALRALFPGGTITGCPKLRCMAIIRDLEREPRGAYTGAMGYISRDGQADFNILIRTMVMHDHQVSLHAGSGIVADSDPLRELEETRAKARGMLLALGAAAP